MNPTPDHEDDAGTSSSDRYGEDTELKSVYVDLREQVAGGWYRELPNAEIEIMSRAQLERIPLGKRTPKPSLATKIAEIVSRGSPPFSSDASEPPGSGGDIYKRMRSDLRRTPVRNDDRRHFRPCARDAQSGGCCA
jgi:hypothetical protein